MEIEKIFKRPDGSKIKVSASLTSFGYNYDLKWRFNIWQQLPGKKKWLNPIDTDGYSYRRLSMQEREDFEEIEKLKFATPEEILEVQLELWELIKPQKLVTQEALQ